MKLFISPFICIVLILSSIICRGNTALNNEQREFLMVQSAFIEFHKNTKRFPTSWDDLWNNPASRPSVEWLDQGKSFGRRTDMIESFRFIAPGTTIYLPRSGSRVIAMMTRPMRPPPDRERRFLIVQLKDGTRGIEQIKEESLQTMFSEIGLKLADYTGPDGNWAPETRLRPLSEIPPRPHRTLREIFSNPLTDSYMDYHATPTGSPPKAAPTKSQTVSTAREMLLWITGGIALILLIATCIWKLAQRKSKMPE